MHDHHIVLRHQLRGHLTDPFHRAAAHWVQRADETQQAQWPGAINNTVIHRPSQKHGSFTDSAYGGCYGVISHGPEPLAPSNPAGLPQPHRCQSARQTGPGRARRWHRAPQETWPATAAGLWGCRNRISRPQASTSATAIQKFAGSRLQGEVIRAYLRHWWGFQPIHPHRWPPFIQQHRQGFTDCCWLCAKARGHPCSLHRTPVRPRLRRVRCPRRGRQGRTRQDSSTVAYCLYEHKRIDQATYKGLNRVSSVVEAGHQHPIGGVLNAEAAVRGRRARAAWRLYPTGFRPEGRR